MFLKSDLFLFYVFLFDFLSTLLLLIVFSLILDAFIVLICFWFCEESKECAIKYIIFINIDQLKKKKKNY